MKFNKVDNNRLIELLENPFLATLDDYSNIINRIGEYPYCSHYRILAAKIAYDHNFHEKNRLLAKAALYSPNRQKLKQIIEAEVDDFELCDNNATVPYRNKNANLYAEVLENLKTAQQQKNEFSFKFDTFLTNKTAAKKKKKINISRIIEHTEIKRPAKDINELVGSFDILSSIQGLDQTSALSTSKVNNEQFNIIDSFLEKDIVIGNLRNENDLTNRSIGDLSKRSSQLDEDFISENIAEVYANQKKYGEAIAIYEKLNLKFPQKKALFVERIEELKKKDI